MPAGHLDGLESGDVVVGEVLEDVSRGEAKRAQAVQDGGFESWAKNNVVTQDSEHSTPPPPPLPHLAHTCAGHDWSKAHGGQGSMQPPNSPG